ncbi:MAG: YdeI/OmpD-associated family protein [Alphaproteobacteria bacterium]|nr:YdeI/OmpD-associated family protein [Alphaproteobacteria bacterium]
MVDAVTFASPEAFEAWLEAHGQSETAIWLRLAKKAADVQSLTYAQALDVALCHGWIDGVKRADTAQHFLQRFTPRKASSPWSKINRDKAEELVKSGRMTDAGRAAIAQAKASGAWAKAYQGSATISVPEDLALALRDNPAAATFFESLNRQNRYAVLYRIGAVKKAETRARKIAEFVSMLARGEKLHP